MRHDKKITGPNPPKMRKKCCVPQCYSSKDKNYSSLSFHRFPTVSESAPISEQESVLRRRNRWISALKIKKEVNEHMRVCSEHFQKSDYFLTAYAKHRSRLKFNAVPSLNLPTTPIPGKNKKILRKILKKISCCVKNCNSCITSGSNITFHKFPADPDLARRWLKRIHQEDFVPSEDDVICSKHFTDDDYLEGHPNKILKDNALPIEVKIPAEKMKMVAKKRCIVKEKVAETKSSDMKSNPGFSDTFSNNELHHSNGSSNAAKLFKEDELQIYSELLDNKSASDLSDVEPLNSDVELSLEDMTILYKKTRKRLKLCQRRCYVYQKEITALREVISSLQQIYSVTDDS